MGEPFEQGLSDMLAFDALLCNTDRHYNNLGFLADSRTNELVAFAPLFDHGNSLFHQAYGGDWLDDEHLTTYASASVLRVYDDFYVAARELMTRETRAKVRGMLGFQFSRGPRLGFSKRRLRMLRDQVRLRAKMLLE